MSTGEDPNGDALTSGVAEVLRAERGARRMTVKEVVKASGVPERSLLRVLSGDHDISVSQIARIAAALGVTGEYVMREAERRAGATIQGVTPQKGGLPATERAQAKADAERLARRVTKATQRDTGTGDAKTMQ